MAAPNANNNPGSFKRLPGWNVDNSMSVKGLVRRRGDHNPMSWALLVDKDKVSDVGLRHLHEIRTQDNLDSEEVWCNRCGRWKKKPKEKIEKKERCQQCGCIEPKKRKPEGDCVVM